MKYTITLLTLAVVCLSGCSSSKAYTLPRAWHGVSEGMMRQQIVENNGQPASQLPSSEIWRKDGWELQIAYDESGQATNVVRILILK
jgi:uncharacterized protein YceK